MMAICSTRVWPRIVAHADMDAFYAAIEQLDDPTLLGLWNMVWRRSASTSKALMRWRVVLQFIALCLVMTALFLSVKR
jgi:hypoxia induced protein